MTQRSDNGQSIINAQASREQGVLLSKVSAFVFDQTTISSSGSRPTPPLSKPATGGSRTRASMRPARRRTSATSYLLATNLTPEQVRETFSTPETVPFWQLPYFIDMAERAGLTATGYRLQYQKLLARPFMLAAMVLLAAAFSLRFFRMGGVQKMVLGGVASGFLLYIMSKLTDDLSKAELLPPMMAAWMPAGDRRHDRICRVVVPGGRLMAGRCQHSCVFVASASQAKRLDPVERGNDRCRRLVAILRRRMRSS